MVGISSIFDLAYFEFSMLCMMYINTYTIETSLLDLSKIMIKYDRNLELFNKSVLPCSLEVEVTIDL